MSSAARTRRKGGAGMPADTDAERAVLGACMWNPAAVDRAGEVGVRGAHFHHPPHQVVWHSLAYLRAQAAPTGPHDVQRELERRGELGNLLGKWGPTFILDLYEHGSGVVDVTYHARVVVDKARAREHITLATKLRQLAEQPEPDHQQIRQLLTDHLDDTGRAAEILHVRDVDEFLTTPDDEEDHDWVIPGVLERGDRVILTGGEGSGKSTLGRQVAIQAAAGIHPFTAEVIDPVSVLIVDFENSEHQLRRKLRPLRVQAGDLLDPKLLHVESRIAGVDLTEVDDREWLTAILAATRPDLLITGPIYKMAGGNPNDEETAKPVALFLDQTRAQVGCAIWLEAHVGNEQAGQRKRPTRPFGWSGWRRWPEFGLWLADDGSIEHWRGDRDERDWPMALTRGGKWPWTPVMDEQTLRWVRIKAIRENHGEHMSIRDVIRETGLSHGAVQRTIGRGGNYAHEWTVLNGIKYDDSADEED